MAEHAGAVDPALVAALDELVRSQAKADDVTWSPVMRSGLARIRHVALHLTKSAGRLAGIVEQLEHGNEVFDEDVATKVAADLVVHAAQISEYCGFDLGGAYAARVRTNLETKGPSGGADSGTDAG